MKKRRILIILPYVPYPLRRGTYQRVYHLTEQLADAFHADLFCLSENSSDSEVKERFERFCERVHFCPFVHPPWPRLFPDRLFDSLPTTVRHWWSPDVEKTLRQFTADHTYDIIYFCDIVLWPYIAKIFPRHPCRIIDRSRVDWLFQSEELQVLPLRIKERLLRRENLAKIRSLEKKIMAAVQLMVVCGEDDRKFLEKKLGLQSKIFVLPNGYNPDFFDPETHPPTPSREPSALFCGALDYTPNVDALRWYFAEIHSPLCTQFPDFTLHIVGKNPTTEVQRWAEEPAVTLHGEVPDVRPYYQRAWFQIVPLRIGGGTRLKIVESLGMGTPVISTTLGAQGLALANREHLLLADNAPDFIAGMAELIENPTLRATLSERGQQCVARHYAWPQLAARLTEKIDALPSLTDTPKTHLLLGIPLHHLTMAQALEHCLQALDEKTPTYFVTANLDFVNQAYHDDELRDLLFHTPLLFCDGKPLVWLSRLFGETLPERVAGSDLLLPLLERCAQRRAKVYFLGSDTTTLEKAKNILEKQFPDLDIVGWQSPPMGPIHRWDNDAICNAIAQSQPDLLLVALGCPKQERWIYAHHQKTGASLSIGIGASLDFVAGKQKRAPRLFQKMGFEWLWRMLHDPRRLWRRYAKDLWSLFTLTSKQWLALHLPHQKLASQPKVSLPEDYNAELLTLKGNLTRKTLSSLPQPRESSRHLICHVAGVKKIDALGLGYLCALARRTSANGRRIFLLHSPGHLSRLIRWLRLTQQLPLASDLTEVQKTLQKRRDLHLAITDHREKNHLTLHPHFDFCLHGKEAVESKLGKLSEDLSKGYSIVLDLAEVPSIDSAFVDRLIYWKNALRKREISLTFTNMQTSVRKTIALLEAEEDLLFSK